VIVIPFLRIRITGPEQHRIPERSVWRVSLPKER